MSTKQHCERDENSKHTACMLRVFISFTILLGGHEGHPSLSPKLFRDLSAWHHSSFPKPSPKKTVLLSLCQFEVTRLQICILYRHFSLTNYPVMIDEMAHVKVRYGYDVQWLTAWRFNIPLDSKWVISERDDCNVQLTNDWTYKTRNSSLTNAVR